MWIKRWLRKHPVITGIIGAISFLFVALPGWAASWWTLISDERLRNWWKNQHLLHLGFPPQYITTPIAGGILLLILWALFVPNRREDKRLKGGLSSPQAPRLRLSCQPNIPGCVKQTRFTGEGLLTNFFRVKVEADGTQSVKNCTAFLTSIEISETIKWGGDSAKLTFAQGEDPEAFSKTVRSKVPEFFDVLAVTSTNKIYPGTYLHPFGRIWPYVPTFSEIFSECGDYLLTVAVTGDEIQTETALLKFAWTRNWQTAELVLISETPQSFDLPTSKAQISFKPLEIEALPPSANLTNKTQLGWTTTGRPVFDGDCIFRIHNPNHTQEIDGVEFRLLSIQPALVSVRRFDPSTDDTKLRRLRHNFTDIDGKTLKGGQTGDICVMSMTRSFAPEESLENICIELGDKRTNDIRNKFMPTTTEHILTAEVTGNGLPRTESQFRLVFSANTGEPVFTMAKLPS
jgi:hypothetical protein